MVAPVLWQLQVSHYDEKARRALDHKHVAHFGRSLLSELPALTAKRLTGDTSTRPVLTIDGRPIGNPTRTIASIEQRWPRLPLSLKAPGASSEETLVAMATPRPHLALN
jgi:hypothetical protein